MYNSFSDQHLPCPTLPGSPFCLEANSFAAIPDVFLLWKIPRFACTGLVPTPCYRCLPSPMLCIPTSREAYKYALKFTTLPLPSSNNSLLSTPLSSSLTPLPWSSVPHPLSFKMRTSFKAAFFVAATCLVALQVAQPVSGHLVDREVFENVAPALYNYDRRRVATAVPTTTSSAAPTSTAAPGSGCKKDSQCASGNCDSGKCVPAQGAGPTDAYCTLDDQCKSGLYCYRGSCQTIKSDGSNCYRDEGCTSGSCVNKKCVGQNSVPRGGACTKSDQCKNNSFCSNGSCDKLGANGDYCYKNPGCASGNCKNNVCTVTPTRKIGQSCTDDDVCVSGFCSKGACAAQRGAGRGCNGPSACISGTCKKNGTCK